MTKQRQLFAIGLGLAAAVACIALWLRAGASGEGSALIRSAERAGERTARGSAGLESSEAVGADPKVGRTPALAAATGGVSDERGDIHLTAIRRIDGFQAPFVEATLVASNGRTRVVRPSRYPYSHCTFADVPPDEYTLKIEDPRYRGWSRAGVRVGESVEAELVGSATVTLEAMSLATGEPVELLEVDAYGPDASVVKVLRPGTEQETPGVIRASLMSGNFILAVRAEGYPEHRVRVLGLRPAESRTVEVLLASGAAVAGRVVEESTGQPIAGALVQVSPTEHPFRFSYQAADRHVSADDFERFARTDTEGGFELRGLPAGILDVHAATNESNVMSLVGLRLRNGDRLGDLRLALAEAASLEVELDAPPDVRPLDYSLVIVPGPLGAKWGQYLEWDGLRVAADEAGIFKASGLAGGEVYLALVAPIVEDFGFDMGSAVFLGTVELEVGKTTRRTYDLGGGWPGGLEVAVTLGGEAVEGATVGLVQVVTQAPNSFQLIYGDTDEAGVASFDTLFPGTYQVEVAMEGLSLPAPSRASTTVVTGKTSLPFHAVEHELRILDGLTDLALSDTELELISTLTEPDGGSSSTMVSLRTDHDGRVRLTLAPGTYQLRLTKAPGKRDKTVVVDLVWTHDGPVSDVLVMP